MESPRGIEVRTSTDNRQEAQAIARTLVEEGLCACAHIDEIESYFRWQGELENITEFRVALACTASALPAVEKRIAELHSYEEPAIYSFDITGGSEGWLSWLSDNSRA